jgi:hypothetical protein
MLENMVWRDKRVYYPFKEIKILDNFYVVDTSACEINELLDFFYVRDKDDSKFKSSLEMARYLSEKNLEIFNFESNSENYYTIRFGGFIISNHPEKYNFFKDYEFALMASCEFYNLLNSFLEKGKPVNTFYGITSLN